MEERKEEGEAEIQEHGPEHWFSKWERQCLAEAEQDEQLPPELQEEAAAAAQPEHKQQKLWHLFQNSATAVAQLYKGEGRRRHLAAAAAASGPTLGREPRGGLPGSGRRPAAPSPQDGGAGPGPRGAPVGKPGAGAGATPLWGPARGPRQLLGAGSRAPPGRGGVPSHKMAKGGGGAGPIVPGAGLGAGTEKGAPPCAAARPRAEPPSLAAPPSTPQRPPSCIPPTRCGIPETLEQNGET